MILMQAAVMTRKIDIFGNLNMNPLNKQIILMQAAVMTHGRLIYLVTYIRII